VKGKHTLSLLLVPHDQNQDDLSCEQHCSLFIAAENLQQCVSETVLQSLFSLSPAEARLTSLLSIGQSLEQVANTLNISRHTARAQLKSVFSKTGTHRQPELVQRVLTSPAIIQQPSSNNVAHRAARATSSAARESSLRLDDGRRLSYAEYGDPYGEPVLFFHSIAGSRMQIHPNHAQRLPTGLHWIVPERPGFGESTPQPGRKQLDWADDIRQLADHLCLESYYLAGYSAGGTHAAACAWQQPQRVRRLALISSMAPFSSVSELAGMPPTNRMLMSMARYTPRILAPFMRIMIQGLKRKPEQITHRHIELWPEADHETLKLPGIREHMIKVFLQALAQSPDAIVQEQILLAQPWGFDPAGIETETHVWHGEADIHVPINMLDSVARMPNQQRHIIPDMGHYLLLTHWREIFETLVA
jgi:pimeloyl-ACP methyl ester carboxylesterase/DNA-binding CsgD family transcriptional regulator